MSLSETQGDGADVVRMPTRTFQARARRDRAARVAAAADERTEAPLAALGETGVREIRYREDVGGFSLEAVVDMTGVQRPDGSMWGGQVRMLLGPDGVRFFPPGGTVVLPIEPFPEIKAALESLAARLRPLGLRVGEDVLASRRDHWAGRQRRVKALRDAGESVPVTAGNGHVRHAAAADWWSGVGRTECGVSGRLQLVGPESDEARLPACRRCRSAAAVAT